MSQQLYLLRGLPGSGKSTLARILSDQGFEHFEADMYHMHGSEYRFNPDDVKAAHEWCRAAAYEALDLGYSVVVSNTFTMLWELDPYLDFAAEFSIKPTVVHLENSFGNVHNVPTDVIARMASRWEPIPK